MTIRTPAQAIAEIQAEIRQHVNIGTGDCQKNAHLVYGIGSGFASAWLAWEGAKFKHSDLSKAPIGAFVYLDGGHTLVQGKPAGHVGIWAGDGHIYTPGGPKDPNHWYLTTIADIRAGWPWHHYVGWTEDINGVRVPGLTPILPKPVHPNIDAAIAAVTKAVHANTGAKQEKLKKILAELQAL
jgi:hypothetical protein